MAEIINLRRVRKRLTRDAAASEAAEARARHGRTGAERRADALEAEAARRILDGARLTGPSPWDGEASE